MFPIFKLYEHNYDVNAMFEDENLTDAMAQVIDGAAFAWAGDSSNPHLSFVCDEGTVIIMTITGELYATDSMAVEQFSDWMTDALDSLDDE